MILKMRTLDEGWYYYQVPKNIKYRKLTDKQYKFGIEIGKPTHVNVDLDKMNNEINMINVICIDDSAVIYTNLIAYLLNDNGKTIEKIN